MIPNTIVVPLDGSDLAVRALHVAAPLARRIGAGVTLVSVVPAAEAARQRAYLDAVGGFGTDVAVTTEVLVDADPAGAIGARVEVSDDHMVCMTTHGRGRLRWAVAGSVAERVIRGSSRPLLLVGPHGVASWSDPPGQIVVAVDGSQISATSLEPACAWAKTLDCEVTLAFVGHPLDVEGAVHPDEVFRGLEDRVRAAGIPVHTRYERSSFVAGALLDVAQEPPATMLVMASHSRVGVARVALGSVTMGVLNTARCPVLVMPVHTD